MFNDESLLDWTKEIPPNEVNHDELFDDGFRLFLNEKPFTGIAVSNYPNGSREFYLPCLNGVNHGQCRWWHRNGKLFELWSTYRGMGHGVNTAWHGNGILSKEAYCEFGWVLDWKEFGADGTLIECGSNRDDVEILNWIIRCRAEFPDAP